MIQTTGSVWVIAEKKAELILPISLQLVGQGRKLADELGTSLEAVLLGSDLDHAASRLISAGADSVFLVDDPRLAHYQSELYTECIFRLANERKPEIMLLGATYMGRELAPLLGARLRTGVVVHSTDLLLDENRLLDQRVPAYGMTLSIKCPERRPQIALVSNGIFSIPEMDEKRDGNVFELVLPDDITPRSELLEIIPKQEEGFSLDQTSKIVVGGAGVMDQSGWELITELSKELNAAVGATRPAVDEGWANFDQMIGQSGKIIHPEFYLGIGVSGELQHMVGIHGAKNMVAINNNPKAPIFDQVDIGIVEDCREFLPILIKKLKEQRA